MFLFLLKGFKSPFIDYKKPRSSDSRLIALKRNLFAKSKVNLFQTKESFNSTNLNGDEAPFNRSRLNSQVSISLVKQIPELPVDEPKQVTISITHQDTTEESNENYLLAPNWVSQTTIEKIREGNSKDKKRR